MKFTVHSSILALVLLVACSSRPPRPPAPAPPVVPGPVDPATPEPAPTPQDLIVFVLDAASRPIVGAHVVIPTFDARTSDGNGFVHFSVPGSVPVEVTAKGFIDRLVDLPPGTHRVHLERAVVPVGPGLGQMPWRGRLRLATGDRGFIDEAGTWQLPLCAHFGEAFSAFVRRPADVEAQLEAIKRAGYDCIRTWDHLGEYSGAWRGKEVSWYAWTNGDGVRVEATADYYGQWRAFLETLKRIGLTIHHSRGDHGRREPSVPGGLSAMVEHSRRLLGLYDQVGLDILALYEGNNEDFQNGNFGPSGLRAIVQPFAERGVITASSCPGHCSEEEEDLRAYTQGFPIFYVHGYRQGEPTNRLQHIFTLGLEAHRWSTTRLGWQGEPTGPHQFPGLSVTVGHTEDVEELGLLAVNAFLARQAWVYMSQYGVFWNGRIDAHAGFYAVPRMRRLLADFAPDVMAWTILHGGRTNGVWCAPTGCAPGHYWGDPGVTRGVRRIEMAVSPDGQQAALTVHGGRPPYVIRNAMGCTARVQVVRARDDETIHVDEVTVPAGGTLNLEYRVGRLLLARCQ